jgi:hypothetical protein
VELARQLVPFPLSAGSDAQVAAGSFEFDLSRTEIPSLDGLNAPHSHFSLHFKRIVGATPRRYQISARIA